MVTQSRFQRPPQCPHLIGVDWGSSSLRVFLIDADGEVIASRSSLEGSSVLQGSASAFQASLENLAGDWLADFPEVNVLACGMVGSQHGWLEVPYVACPADSAAIARKTMTVKDVGGRRIAIVPGLRCDDGAGRADVMRGEETQIIGALAAHPEARSRSCLVLPGTHSKWAQVDDGKVSRFATHMTGELFAVLRQHSVLGRLMPSTPSAESSRDPLAFLRGVDDAQTGAHLGLTQQLFAVRTLGLMEQLPKASLSDYLSGLLIGHEVQAGLSWRLCAGLEHSPLLVVGDTQLCGYYAQALTQCGVGQFSLLDNTAARGLWSLSQASDLASVSAFLIEEKCR